MEVPTINGWMKALGFIGIYVALLTSGHWGWAIVYCLVMNSLYTDWRGVFKR